MSVLIKGMKMPTSCLECAIKNGELGIGLTVAGAKCPICTRFVTKEEHDMKSGIHPQCPLVELPEKHGRLIDADAAKAHFKDEGMRVSKLTVMAVLNNAQTIIEEEMSE